jgi:dTDP-4-dehydrorhamnose reductase
MPLLNAMQKQQSLPRLQNSREPARGAHRSASAEPGFSPAPTAAQLPTRNPEAPLFVVGDQLGNPTSALDLADAILHVASNLLAKPDDEAMRGIFHSVGRGEASWAKFATEILAASKALGGPWAEVIAIPASEYPTPVRRPANSRLATDRLADIHGVRFPDWQVSTRATVRRLVP